MELGHVFSPSGAVGGRCEASTKQMRLSFGSIGARICLNQLSGSYGRALGYCYSVNRDIACEKDTPWIIETF